MGWNDDAGRHVRTSRPNAMRSEYRYNRAGRLEKLNHSHEGETLAEFNYTVNANGNRTQVVENIRPTNATIYRTRPH